MIKEKANQGKDVLIKLGTWLLIFYCLFLLGKSIWTNYQLRQSIRKLEQQMVELKIDKTNLENLIVYYKSDSFKELEARRRLGYRYADEKVVIVAQPSSEPNYEDELKKNQANFSSSRRELQRGNWEHWLNYFFGSD